MGAGNHCPRPHSPVLQFSQAARLTSQQQTFLILSLAHTFTGAPASLTLSGLPAFLLWLSHQERHYFPLQPLQSSQLLKLTQKAGEHSLIPTQDENNFLLLRIPSNTCFLLRTLHHSY